MLTIFAIFDLGNLTPAPVTPAPCWRFCFTPRERHSPEWRLLFRPWERRSPEWRQPTASSTILVQREPCSAGRSLRSPAAFSSVARRCISCIQTSASNLKSRREGGDFNPARSAGCLCITKQESRRDGALSIEHYRVESRRFEQEPESLTPFRINTYKKSGGGGVLPLGMDRAHP